MSNCITEAVLQVILCNICAVVNNFQYGSKKIQSDCIIIIRFSVYNKVCCVLLKAVNYPLKCPSTPFKATRKRTWSIF